MRTTDDFVAEKGEIVHVAAIEDTGRALWHATGRSQWHDFAALGVWTEKRAARGEDAEPLFVHNGRRSDGIVAVFDGAGGAGSAIEGASPGAVDRTGAWVGSRVARAATEEWFVHTEQQGSARDSGGLRDAMAARLGDMHTKRRRKISGTMRRELPTTLAALHYRLDGPDVWWRAMWAGDSRCYALTSVAGLQQLSKDDTESSDALELLNSDPPMTNLIAADGKFVIHQHEGGLPAPCVLLTATDGFFGYVHAPADFEFVLLNTLVQSSSLREWGDRLVSAVGSYTGDDASLVLLAVGFERFERLRDTFIPRRDRLGREHYDPVRIAMKEGRQALVAARTDSWSRYRGDYEHQMPRRGEQGDER
jgi:hypothetical protein